MQIPADKEHLIAVALHRAADGDSSLLNQLVAQIKADRVFTFDRRIPGLEHAEGIADHWHQRFLLLQEQASSLVRRSNLGERAESAKVVLDDIKAERKRLESGAP